MDVTYVVIYNAQCVSGECVSVRGVRGVHIWVCLFLYGSRILHLITMLHLCYWQLHQKLVRFLIKSGT